MCKPILRGILSSLHGYSLGQPVSKAGLLLYSNPAEKIHVISLQRFCCTFPLSDMQQNPFPQQDFSGQEGRYTLIKRNEVGH